jgi:hypothetical protein
MSRASALLLDIRFERYNLQATSTQWPVNTATVNNTQLNKLTLIANKLLIVVLWSKPVVTAAANPNDIMSKPMSITITTRNIIRRTISWIFVPMGIELDVGRLN